MDTNSDQKSINLTLNFGDDVGDTGEGARGGRPLAEALVNRAHYLLQPVDVSL